MSSPPPTPAVITAWAVISPFGVGRELFRDGLREGRHARPNDPGLFEATPGEPARVVPGFGPAQALGKKGTRSMDRVTALAVATAGQLLASDGVPAGSDTGFVLGTTTGSAQSMMDFTRSSLTAEKPFFVDPARFPNTVMNCAAGQSAIWHRLKGPNATIGGGRAAGLLALNYARRLQRTGRARRVLCGGAEEYSYAQSWLQRHAREADEVGGFLGEGCALLLVEPGQAPGDREAGAGRAALAEVMAIEFGVFTTTDDLQPVLAACLRRAMAAGDVSPPDLWLIAPSSAGGAAGELEHAAIVEVLGDTGARWFSCAELIGDALAGAAAFQLAAVLALAEGDPAAAGRVALVTAVDRDGVAGCALLRVA